MSGIIKAIILLTVGVNAVAADYVPREELVAAGASYGARPAGTDELTSWGWYLLMDVGDVRGARGAFAAALTEGPGPALEAALEGYGRACEIVGDYDEAVKAYVELFTSYPGSPVAEIYVHRASVILENTNQHDYFASALESLAEGGETPYLAGRANIYLYYLYAARGETEKARDALERFNPIDDWMVIGPFNNEGKSGFAEEYGPEKAFDLSAAYEGKERTVRWRPLPYAPPGGFLNARQIFRPEDFGCAYLATSVRSPEDRAGYISVGTAGAYKIWVNGELACENDVYRPGYFDQDILPVGLRAGENLLLVKLCGDDVGWNIGCRFLNADGSAMTDVTYSAAPRALTAARRAKSAGPLPEIPAFDSARLFWDREIVAGSVDPFTYLYGAMLHLIYDEADRTDELPKALANTAVELRPGWADLHFYAGLLETNKNKSRAEFEEALKRAPAHAEACVEIAKYYINLERPESAREYLDAALSINPGHVAAKQYLAKLDWEDGWGYEARRTAEEILAGHPDYAYARIILGLYYKQYESLDRALEELTRAYELDRTESSVHGQIYYLLLDRGRFDEAFAFGEELVAADPYDLESMRTLGRSADMYGRYEEALKWFDRALSVCPEDYFALAYKGLTLEKMGRTAEAKEAYELAVEYKHNYPWLSDYLDYLEPAGAARDSGTDAYALLAEYPGDSFYPRDSAVHLLDKKTVEVYPNGTKSETVHRVIKILTPDGVEKFRRLYIVYTPDTERVELLRTAVIKADGDEVTATDVYESDVYDVWSRLYYSVKNKVVSMPNLAPGDTIDFKYRVSETGKNIFADYFGDTFVFGNENSTLLAEYTLTLPDNRRFYFHRVRGAPEPEVKREGDRTTYTFEATDIPRISPEPYAPKLVEIRPYVQVSTFASWEDMAKWYSGLIADVLKPTPETEQVGKSLTGAIGEDTERLTAVYNFVSRNIRYVGLEFGIGGWRPHKPKNVMDTAYGDCKDQSTLINTIARSLGYEAYPALVRTRDLGELDFELPALGLFNHMISYVILPDGRAYFLDPTAEYNARDELPVVDQGVSAFIIDGKGGYFVRTPSAGLDENTNRTEMVFELSATGSAFVHRRVEYGKLYGPGQRYGFLTADNPRDIVEEFWNGIYAGTEVFNDVYEGLEEPFTKLAIEYDAKIPAVFSPTDEQVIIPVRFYTDNLVNTYGTSVTREYPLQIKDGFRSSSKITLVYPDNLIPSVVPLTKELKSDYGSIKTSVTNEPGRLTAEITLELPAQEIPPEEYPEFRQFCLDADDWQAERFILVRRR